PFSLLGPGLGVGLVVRAWRPAPRLSWLASGTSPTSPASPGDDRPLFRLYQSYARTATAFPIFRRGQGPTGPQLHPEVAPQVSHLQQAPLRTSVSWPHSEHGSPS